MKIGNTTNKVKLSLNLEDLYPVFRSIGRGGSVELPPRSPDLTSLDFYLWCHLKDLVYDGTEITSEANLVARISADSAAGSKIKSKPQVLRNDTNQVAKR